MAGLRTFNEREAEVLAAVCEVIVPGSGRVSPELYIDAAARGWPFSQVEAVRAAEASQQVAALTQREREILALIALGLTNQEICDREWLSMPTVKTHVSHLLSKTGCRDRVQLVLLALRGGVVDLDDVLGRA